jgi:virginiamycin B lyase
MDHRPGRVIVRRTCIVFVSVAVLAALPAARADWPITQAACPGVTAAVSLWKQLGTDTLENLGFDGLGNVWISNSTQGRIERYRLADGAQTATVTVPAPGAITLGPNGKMYVNFGNALVGAFLRTRAAGVKLFNPTDADLVMTTFADGFHMANGAIFDAAGNLYVSNDVDAGLKRITPAGVVEQFSDVWGTNGLVVLGESLYAAITFDQRSPIEQIPLAAPQSHSTFTELSFGSVSLQPAVHQPTVDPATTPLVGLKGLDDMTLGPDGRFYVVANGMGELLRVDPATKAACLLASGLRNPSSLRFDPGSGDLFITEFSGAIKHVKLTPAS